jgi:uncharacterized membrane protein YqjE
LKDSDRGSTAKKSRLSEIIALLEDHLELLSLELRYERSQGARRLVAWGVAGALALCAFVFLQIALVRALVHAGFGTGWVCLGLGAAYVIAAAIVYRLWGRRDARAGAPFQSSREELSENLKWIRKIFS